MERQRFLDVLTVDERIDFAVRIAADVAKDRMLRGRRIQAVDRHDRKELPDRPAIRTRLKQRKVAEIRICHELIKALKVLRNFFHLLDDLLQLEENSEIKILRFATLVQRKIAR